MSLANAIYEVKQKKMKLEIFETILFFSLCFNTVCSFAFWSFNEVYDPNFKLYEGDIAVSNAENTRSFSARARKWPQGIVPYLIDPGSGYTKAEITTIHSAMNDINRFSNCRVSFIPRTFETDYILIKDNNACYSFIGRQTKQPQILSLLRPKTKNEPHCIKNGYIVHELMHALGFLHEQSRSDRDRYVKILWQNIITDMMVNFDSFSSSEVSDLGLPYDITSLMQYKWNAFTKNGEATILPVDSSVSKFTLGSSDNLSEGDKRKIIKLYEDVSNFYCSKCCRVAKGFWFSFAIFFVYLVLFLQ